MSGLLFIAFVFLTTHLNSKFFIFFISGFANIFCYSAVLNDQYNFSYVVLLNIIFMLIIAFYYILIDIEEDSLPIDFIKRTPLKYFIIIISFLISFVSILSIFRSFVRRSEILNINKPSVVVVDYREKMKTKNKNLTIEKKLIDAQHTNIKNIVYEKTFKDIKMSVFKYFNTAILIYVIFLSVNYFIYKEN
jgi:hypothetical protein